MENSPAAKPCPQQSSAKTAEATSEEAADRFVGQWNRLVSTTNWEKGCIICQWREALMAEGVSVTQYSDEAWSQLVGNVTSQHVGRLRRVFQRFGDMRDQYEGLFWSHFQAALDWDDAEMWLEGAIQNEWSVSQMRGKRWETLGTPPEEQAQQVTSDAAALDEDAAWESPAEEADVEVRPVHAADAQPQSQAVAEAETDGSLAGDSQAEDSQPEPPVQSAPQKRQRLDVAMDDLPEDIAEAFEQFKLAIIAQRRKQWQEISPDGVIECLDALKELAIAE